jgi:hypothetical protein
MNSHIGLLKKIFAGKPPGMPAMQIYINPAQSQKKAQFFLKYCFCGLKVPLTPGHGGRWK